MNGFGIGLACMIVILAVKPAVLKARKSIKQARRSIRELRHRQHAISHQIRALARESLAQRHTADADDGEVGEMHQAIAGLTRRIQELEAIDRRILVLDERRGLQETGWIILVRREGEVPPLEPTRVTRAWQEGRYIFYFATDLNRARRKAQARFPAAQGYQVIDVFPHEGDLSEPPTFGAKRETA
ncbi:MAG TPA: hypothetical protein VED40_21905 [Azospirillaceae bacterium]|nr:hypothetical protein [Azospirillaceae bacterium]